MFDIYNCVVHSLYLVGWLFSSPRDYLIEKLPFCGQYISQRGNISQHLWKFIPSKSYILYISGIYQSANQYTPNILWNFSGKYPLLGKSGIFQSARQYIPTFVKFILKKMLHVVYLGYMSQRGNIFQHLWNLTEANFVIGISRIYQFVGPYIPIFVKLNPGTFYIWYIWGNIDNIVKSQYHHSVNMWSDKCCKSVTMVNVWSVRGT